MAIDAFAGTTPADAVWRPASGGGWFRAKRRSAKFMAIIIPTICRARQTPSSRQMRRAPPTSRDD